MKILLLGGTDMTLAVALKLQQIGFPPAGVVHLGHKFGISYQAEKVQNVRYANLSQWCEHYGIAHAEFSDGGTIRALQGSVHADVAIAAGWYHMISASVRNSFRFGVLGLHHSLLPQLRGGAPLNWAIINGEHETGTSLFQMAGGVDDGPILGQRRVPISPRTTISELIAAAQGAALQLLGDVIPKFADGRVIAKEQLGEPTYCLQRKPSDSRIVWSKSAVEIDRLVRASSEPYQGSWCLWQEQKLVIWQADPVEGHPRVYGAPGQLFRSGSAETCVVTGEGLLRLARVTSADGQDAMPVLERSAQQRLT